MLIRLSTEFLKYRNIIRFSNSAVNGFNQSYNNGYQQCNYYSITSITYFGKYQTNFSGKKADIQSQSFYNVKVQMPERTGVDISQIQSVFADIEISKAIDMVRKYPNLEKKISLETLNYLISNCVPLLRISNMPWLLLLDPQLIKEKVNQVMAMLKIKEFACSVPFIDLKNEKLMEISALWYNEFSCVQNEIVSTKSCNRLYYISERLKCNPVEVADMMNKVKRLMNFSLFKLDSGLTLLLDGGIKTEDIIIDPWVLLHNQAEMKRRLDAARKKNISLRPWLLRCPYNQYYNSVRRATQEKMLLEECKSLQGFLQNRLKCNEETVMHLLLRAPFLKKTSLTKLNEMILLLISYGFNPTEIVKVPQILALSAETVESRIQTLSNCRGYNVTLSVLCHSSRKYQTLLHRLNNQT